MLDTTRYYEYNRNTYAFNGNNWVPIRMPDSSVKFYWSNAQFQHFYENNQVEDVSTSPGETLRCDVHVSRNSGNTYVILPYKYGGKTITFKITEVDD